MELLVNDLSVEGQFHEIATFREAIARVMIIRQVVHQFGRELYCHRNFANAYVLPDKIFPAAVGMLTLNEQRAIMQWVTKQGPFWDDDRFHDPEQWLECKDIIVTDTAIGEAAWCCFNGLERTLVSLIPSSWKFTPLCIFLLNAFDQKEEIRVQNFLDAETVEKALQDSQPPIRTWEQISKVSQRQFKELSFADNAFAPLNGFPFHQFAAERILVLLTILNNLKTCFDEDGKRTDQGHELYRNYFAGKKGNGGSGPLFSDSSESEKNRYRERLTFKHPMDDSTHLFCPWHGKIHTPPIRIHFSWPFKADEPAYIVYVGPKITKQ